MLGLEVAIVGLIQAVMVAVIGGLFARNSKKQKVETELIEARAAIRAEESRLSMQLMSASVNLGVVTAVAVKDGKANGNVNEAVSKAHIAQQEYYNFINTLAAKKLSK